MNKNKISNLWTLFYRCVPVKKNRGFYLWMQSKQWWKKVLYCNKSFYIATKPMHTLYIILCTCTLYPRVMAILYASSNAMTHEIRYNRYRRPLPIQMLLKYKRGAVHVISHALVYKCDGWRGCKVPFYKNKIVWQKRLLIETVNIIMVYVYRIPGRMRCFSPYDISHYDARFVPAHTLAKQYFRLFFFFYVHMTDYNMMTIGSYRVFDFMLYKYKASDFFKRYNKCCPGTDTEFKKPYLQ